MFFDSKIIFYFQHLFKWAIVVHLTCSLWTIENGGHYHEFLLCALPKRYAWIRTDCFNWKRCVVTSAVYPVRRCVLPTRVDGNHCFQNGLARIHHCQLEVVRITILWTSSCSGIWSTRKCARMNLNCRHERFVAVFWRGCYSGRCPLLKNEI